MSQANTRTNEADAVLPDALDHLFESWYRKRMELAREELTCRSWNSKRYMIRPQTMAANQGKACACVSKGGEG